MGFCGLLFTALILALFLRRLLWPPVSEDDVLECLSGHTWKTGTEIRRELESGFPNKTLNVGILYARLESLEEQNLVVWRYKTLSTAESEARGGRPAREYKLKTGTQRNDKRREVQLRLAPQTTLYRPLKR